MKTRGKVPMRQCTGCREMKNKKEMMRVLKTGEGEILLDTTGRKTAGAHICAIVWNVWKRPGRIRGWSVR